MNSKNFFFELISKSNNYRLGKIHTQRGMIDTPAFMPVGTQGTVKSIFVDDLKKTGTQIILGNTYHLFLRPGIQILDKFGGLHRFMNWDKPILTDSGGFQIMSLSKLTKIDQKKGAYFSSHIDGKKFLLSPEKSIQIQKSINSDILMVLDECPKLTMDKKIIISISTFEDKVGLAVGVSQDLISKYNAVELVKKASAILGGTGGGGRKDFAQAGGVDKNKIEDAFKEILKMIS